jgi:hypothetical protein
MRCPCTWCALALVVVITASVMAPSISSNSDALFAQAAKTYKGLEVNVAGIERATNVSLTDCPPGENIVRGVIKPGDTNEFASIKVDFKVTPAFKPGPLPKPVLHDEAGKTYNTAQSFADIGANSAFSCTFSFRVPKGTKLARLALDTLSVDLRGITQ